MIGRTTGHDIDRATSGIAAIERPLRSAQHFDPVDIEKQGADRRRTADIDAINIGGGRAVRTRDDRRRADAPDKNRCVALVGGDLHAGCNRSDLFDRGNRPAGKLFPAERGYRHRRILNGFFAAIGRHNDHVATIVLRCIACIFLCV